MLEFLLTTDVGGWVPGVEEDDAVSAVSELEVREWMEEQGAGAEVFFFCLIILAFDLAAGAEESDGEGAPLFLPTPDFMASAGEG